jgi:hypothetical protein
VKCKPPPKCMVCYRNPGVVVRGKALYCKTCVSDDPAAMDRANEAARVRTEAERRTALARAYRSSKGGGSAGHANPGGEHSW